MKVSLLEKDSRPVSIITIVLFHSIPFNVDVNCERKNDSRSTCETFVEMIASVRRISLRTESEEIAFFY